MLSEEDKTFLMKHLDDRIREHKTCPLGLEASTVDLLNRLAKAMRAGSVVFAGALLTILAGALLFVLWEGVKHAVRGP